MIAIVKAKFSNGVLTPLEPLNLEEGKEVMVSIEDAVEDKPLHELQAVAGAWKGTHDPEELLHNIYSDGLVRSRAGPKL